MNEVLVMRAAFTEMEHLDEVALGIREGESGNVTRSVCFQ